MRFAVLNTKGGVGKTTVAVHLATGLSRRKATAGASALLIDGDPQASAASWAAWRREATSAVGGPITVRLAGRAIVDEGRRLAMGHMDTVVDVGGQDSAGLRAALMFAEVAIVPVGASALDAAAITDLLEVVELARDLNPELRVKVLLARIDQRTRDAADMLPYLCELGLQVLDVRVRERVAYRRAVGAGLVVSEMDGPGRDPMAVAEMAQLLEEVTR
jgi:chromosome partitioning protein